MQRKVLKLKKRNRKVTIRTNGLQLTKEKMVCSKAMRIYSQRKGTEIVNRFNKYVADMKATIGGNSKCKCTESLSKFNTTDIKDNDNKRNA
jgi:hypothetical protein